MPNLKPQALPKKEPQLREKIFETTGIYANAPDWESYFLHIEQGGAAQKTHEILAKLCDVVEALEKEVYGTTK